MNVGKRKALVFGKTETRERLDLSVKREILEEVNSLKYLGSIVSKNGVLLKMW